MSRCGTCAYWKLVDYGGLGSAIVNPVDPDTWEPMVLPYLLFSERPLKSSDACLVDGSGYAAELITGPEFGCSQHTPLEPLSGEK